MRNEIWQFARKLIPVWLVMVGGAFAGWVVEQLAGWQGIAGVVAGAMCWLALEIRKQQKMDWLQLDEIRKFSAETLRQHEEHLSGEGRRPSPPHGLIQ